MKKDFIVHKVREDLLSSLVQLVLIKITVIKEVLRNQIATQILIAHRDKITMVMQLQEVLQSH